MKKYTNAKLTLFIISLVSIITIVIIPVLIGLLCMPLVGEVFAYLIAGGLAIIFGAVMFNNSVVRNVYERWKSIRKIYSSKVHPDAEAADSTIKQEMKV